MSLMYASFIVIMSIDMSKVDFDFDVKVYQHESMKSNKFNFGQIKQLYCVYNGKIQKGLRSTLLPSSITSNYSRSPPLELKESEPSKSISILQNNISKCLKQFKLNPLAAVQFNSYIFIYRYYIQNKVPIVKVYMNVLVYIHAKCICKGITTINVHVPFEFSTTKKRQAEIFVLYL